MHHSDQVAQRRDGVELPGVARRRTETLGGGCGPRAGPGGVSVPENAKGGNGPEENVADAPEDGPLVTEQTSAFGVRRGGGVREADEEGGDAHEGLGYCVAWSGRGPEGMGVSGWV